MKSYLPPEWSSDGHAELFLRNLLYRLSAYGGLTRRCVSASILPRACLHVQVFPVISCRLCLEIAVQRLVRNVGRSLFSMNIHVSGGFQTDKQGFVTSKGQWGGEGQRLVSTWQTNHSQVRVE